VIGALLYLPFGKFFHIFQRPAQLGVKLYQDGGRARRGRPLRALRQALRLAHADRRPERVLPELGFDYRIGGPRGHLAGLCPECKRTTLASAQLRDQEELVAKPPHRRARTASART
jgi:MFS transporter, NNP family, nitrate/nitrite transporter